MDSQFLQQEVRGDYLVSAHIKALWAVQLELLEVFVRVCREEGLRFFAMFGTMLGAVRHGGYIPWDDDLDLVMPRADYDRLRTMGTAFPHPYYLQTPEGDPAFCGRILRLIHEDTTYIPKEKLSINFAPPGHLGCAIEILPLDEVDSPERAEQIGARLRKLQKLRHLRSILERTPYEQLSPFYQKRCAPVRDKRYRELTEAYHAACTLCRDEGIVCDYLTVPMSRHNKKALCFDRALFARAQMLPFEHLELPVPVGYRELIHTLYGEGLPPKRKRKPRHGGIVDTATPYKEYQRPFTDLLRGAEGKKILLFGAGDMLNVYMRRHGDRFPPAALFDNDPAKWGTELYGAPVRPPAELPALLDEHARLIVASIHYPEIRAQLRDMGIPAKEIYVFTEF